MDIGVGCCSGLSPLVVNFGFGGSSLVVQILSQCGILEFEGFARQC